MMDHLWAPWRSKYIRLLKNSPKKCVFCRIHTGKKDRKNYVVVRTKFSFAVLNIYPYNNGHLLIVPNRHVDSLSKLNRNEREDLWDLLETMKKLLDKVLRPEGYNIGINLGRVAGAGFPGHLHIHMVPRWRGDVNFMPVIGNTKIISQSLQTLFKRLRTVVSKINK